MSLFISYPEILLRLGFTTICAIIFGIERKRKQKPVGARTHILVSIAACQIAIISAYGFKDAYHVYPSGVNAVSDPARLVVGILTGIGFIGAGIISKSPSGSIKGITTAAEIFLMASLGIGWGLGLYLLTGTVAIIAFATMLINRVTAYIQKKRHCKNHKSENTKDVSPIIEDSNKIKFL